jgi:hypothetical protein
METLNQHHAQIHTSELRRQAEIERLAALARASRRDARTARPSSLQLTGLTSAIRAARTRLGTAPALGTKVRRV